MTELELGWLSGIIEGEGYIGCRKPKGNYTECVINVSMTDKDIIDRLHSLVPCSKVYGPVIDPRGYKDLWTFRIQRRHEVVRVLTMLLPYLGERRRSAAENVLAVKPIRSLKEI